jgi:site-specific recombinase XerD
MQAANLLMFPQGTNNGTWISMYSETCLSHRNPGTIDVYQRVLRDFLLWFAELSGQASSRLEQLTGTTVEMYITPLEEAAYSMSHRTRVKSDLSSFCQSLIDEYGLLKEKVKHIRG